MSDKGGVARILGQNRTFEILGLEKDLNESPQIVNSPLKTEIKRADTAAFAFVEPTKDLNLGGGIGQNLKKDVKNAFQENGISATQPAKNKKGRPGQGGGAPLQNAGGAYNDPPPSAPRLSTASNAFDDDQTQMQPPPPNLYGDGQTGNARRESISLEHSDGTEPPNGAASEALNQATFGKAYDDNGDGMLEPHSAIGGGLKAYDDEAEDAPIGSDPQQPNGGGAVKKPVYAGWGSDALAGAWNDTETTKEEYFKAPPPQPNNLVDDAGLDPQRDLDDAAEPEPAQQDFKFQEVAYFAQNTRTRFADRHDKRELISKQDVVKTAHLASVMGRINSRLEMKADGQAAPAAAPSAELAQKAKAHGIGGASPIARMNVRTTMTVTERRQFFRDKAREKYHFVGDDGGKQAFDKLTWRDRAELKYNELVHMFGGTAKFERGAFAVDMALDKAIGVSMKTYESDQQALRAKARKQIDALYADGKQPTQAERRQLEAELIEDSERLRERMHALTPEGIEAGKKALAGYLKRDPDNNFPDAYQRGKIAEEFEKWAGEYNQDVDQRNDLREERRSVMANSALKEMGFNIATPAELRRLVENDAESQGIYDKAISDAEQMVSDEHQLNSWKGYLAAGLNWISRGHARNVLDWVNKYDPTDESLEEEVNAKFLDLVDDRLNLHQRLSQHIEDEHRSLAQNWVLDEYKFDPEKAKTIGAQQLHDPHYLYAAFGNFSKKEIIESLERQFTLAAGFDPRHPPGENDENYEDYQRFSRYVGAMAKGAFEGLRDGLHASAGDQLRLRVIDKMTADANSYVVSANARMRLDCHRAWQQIDDAVGTYDWPGKRSVARQDLDEMVEELNDIEKELLASDDDGTFELTQDDDDAKPIRITLPPNGERRALLQDNLDAARKDIETARATFIEVDAIMGRYGEPDSIRGMQQELDKDLDQLRYGLDDDNLGNFGQIYDQHEKRVANLKNRVEALKDTMPPEAHYELTTMVNDLAQRVQSQRTIRERIAEVQEALVKAESSADLHAFNSTVGLFDGAVRLEADLLANLHESVAVTDNFIQKDLTRLREKVKIQIDGTRSLLKLKEDSGARIDQLKGPLAKGDITLRQAVTNANKSIDKALADRQKFAAFNVLDTALSVKFDNVKSDLDDQVAQLLPAALGVDTDQQMSDRATGLAKKLLAAGQDNEAVLEALKTRLAEIGGDNPTLANVETLLEEVGDSEQQIGVFADNFFAEKPELALSFKLAMMRQNDASEEDLATLKHQHYYSQARLMVANGQEAVGKAYNALVVDKKPPQAQPNAGTHLRPPAPKHADDSDLDIHSEDSGDDDGDGGGRPLELGIIDDVVTLSKLHPLFRGVSDKWVSEAAKNLEKLIYLPDKDNPMTSAEVSQARTFATMIASLTGDEDDLAATRQKFQEEEAANVRRQILAEFGLQEADLDENKKMSDTTTAALVDPQNAKALQDIGRRSAAVRSLMAVQQQEAEAVKGAIIEPLREFSKLIQDEELETAEDVMKAMEGDKFRAKAKVLQDLCRLQDAKEVAQHKKDQGLEESDVYRANVMAMKALAPRLRGFDPKSMKAGNQTVNKLAMWWNKETAGDVAKSVLSAENIQAADRFSAVWKHMSMLDAIAESNEDLTQDLENLQKQHDSLLSRVRRHRQDQLVALAILEEYKNDSGSLDSLDLQKAETLQSIQERLSTWGQPDAWAGFAERNSHIVEQGVNATILQKWRSEASSLPADIQADFDQLNRALDSFELLLKQSSAAQKAITGSPLDPERVAQYQAAQADEAMKELPPDKAGHQYGGMLRNDAAWHLHADWPGKSAAELREMEPVRFARELKVGLLQYRQHIKDSVSAKGLKEDELAADAKWVEGPLMDLLDEVDRFNGLMANVALSRQYNLTVSDSTRRELKELGDSIKKKAADLRPKSRDGKTHRFKGKGSARHRYYVPTNHFLNKVDSALSRNLPNMVDQQLARLDQ